MSLNDLRRRIEALNREALPPPADSAAPTEQAPVISGVKRQTGLGSNRLEALIDGHEYETAAGRCYRVQRRLSVCWRPNEQIATALQSALSTAERSTGGLELALTSCAAAGPGGLLFLDLETCGFAGTPVFLIGTLRHEDGDLLVEQLLARNYEEEKAILAEFFNLCRPDSVLVTFNGKTFDWPFLRDRAEVHRIGQVEPSDHCDLLHVVRRRYRDVLPDCKLQTLERYVCKRRRQDDIPGGDIPAAYHDFVRSGNARLLRDVVHHNFLDLVTLAELLMDALRCPTSVSSRQ